MVGEDSAAFDIEKQTKEAWTLFFGLLTGVLGLIFVVYPLPCTSPAYCTTLVLFHCILPLQPHNKQILHVQVWVNPSTGYGDEFLGMLTGLTEDNTELTMILILVIFACVHSGLAGFRKTGVLTFFKIRKRYYLVCSF